MSNNVCVPRIKKMVRVLIPVMKIFLWILSIGFVLSLIAGIAMNFIPENIFTLEKADNLGFVLSQDGLIRYKVDNASIGISLRPIYQLVAFMASIGTVALAIILKRLIALLRTVEKDQPFSEENSKHLTIIGSVLLLGSIGFRILGAMIANEVIKTFKITNINVNLSIDMFMALTGLLILILAGIFRYGNYLQQEYDSTL